MFANMNETEQMEFEEAIFDTFQHILEENIIKMSSPNFMENLIETVVDTISNDFTLLCIHEEEIYEYVEELIENYFEAMEKVLPPRSCNICCSPFAEEQNTKDKILLQIEKLRLIVQPKQKTPEWYKFRYNLITASQVYKALGSQALQNSLIYEKCKPFTTTDIFTNSNYAGNLSSNPRQWGTVFETLSIQIYEDMFPFSKIEDFGCIQHPIHKFIGSSPDGINVGLNSNRFGRMIEVKNIVNREITGIPKEEYWIQMQMQMETCDLEECDFIETRFKEYSNEEEFYQSFETTPEIQYKGVLLCFVEHNNNILYPPIYVFMPLTVELKRENIQGWIENTKNQYSQTYTLFETYYWYLDEFSCILVKRNQIWFQYALPKIRDTWKTIETERETGYAHRAPKKRNTGCFVKINKEEYSFETKEIDFLDKDLRNV
jgi:hypothetical protein